MQSHSAMAGDSVRMRSHAHCAWVSFNSCHALPCSKGGFTFVQHNEIRDLTANLGRLSFYLYLFWKRVNSRVMHA